MGRKLPPDEDSTPGLELAHCPDDAGSAGPRRAAKGAGDGAVGGGALLLRNHLCSPGVATFAGAWEMSAGSGELSHGAGHPELEPSPAHRGEGAAELEPSTVVAHSSGHPCSAASAPHRVAPPPPRRLPPPWPPAAPRRPPTPPRADPAGESEHEGEMRASQQSTRGVQRPRWIGRGGPHRQPTLVRGVLDLK